MRLLITGGAGYIGGFVTRMLLEAGHEITVVDNLSAGHRRAAGDARLVTADFGDHGVMRQLLRDERTECVFHFAGLKSVAESIADPGRYHEHNVSKTESLLRAMRVSGVEFLVYSGTCAVYGPPSRLPVREDHPLRPMNPYGRTKMLAELAISQAAAAGGFRYAILRYFNAAGADPGGMAGEGLGSATNLVPIVMKTVLKQLPHVPVYGTDYDTPDGTAVRDYIHVLDLAAAHVHALSYLRSGGESVTLNLGTGTGYSVREVISATERALGRAIPVVEGPRREGDPPAIWADATQARGTLGWQPRLGVNEIVESALVWHQRHPHGYD